MPRDFARCHQDRVETDIPDHFIGIGCEPHFGRRRDPPPLTFIDRFRSLIKTGARFHFREHQKLTPARDDVDFAERAAPAPCQNPESLRDQENGSTALGGDSNAKRCLPFGAR